MIMMNYLRFFYDISKMTFITNEICDDDIGLLFFAVTHP
jgi:hypothetical protein